MKIAILTPGIRGRGGGSIAPGQAGTRAGFLGIC